jgi:hypothetical protein
MNNLYWWKQDKTKVHESVFEVLNQLTKDQSYRQMENFKNMKLYGNYDLFNLRSYASLRAENNVSLQNRITLNIIQNMIDTVVSKITKNKPKPKFLTEGGDFSLQSKAKKLNQFVEGQFQATDFYAKSALAFLDSCIFGTGALKIYKQNGEIKVERVFIDELIVSDKESFYGEPRQMHQKKYIHKDVLKDIFPKRHIEIDKAADETSAHDQGFKASEADMVLVTESWHLPSGKDAKDGKHAICISNCTLHAEDYDKHYFPFVFWRWGLRPLGFFGQGLSEQLTGLQLEINKILRTIQVSMHLCSVPKIFVEQGSKIVDSHLDNKIGGIIKYSGVAPTPGQLGIIPAELFTHLDRLYSRSYEIAGISQLSSTSQKPSGLNSGKALREYNDIETERFMSVGQRYERAFLDAARQMIDLAKEIDEESEEDGGYKVQVKGKNFLKTIKWKEVSLADDMYQMTLFPTSALSSTPSSRLQDVQELIQAGFVSREEALKLLDFPDLESFYNFSNAGTNDIDRTIEMIIDDGDYQSPEPYQNLALGISKMQQAYLLYRSQNAPEARLELFRRWIEDAKNLLDRAQMEVQKQEAQAQLEAEQTVMAQQGAVEAKAMEDVNTQAQIVDSQIPTDVTEPIIPQ